MKIERSTWIIGICFIAGMALHATISKLPNSTYRYKKIVYKSGQNLTIPENAKVEIYDDYLLLRDFDDGKLVVPMDQILSVTLH